MNRGMLDKSKNQNRGGSPKDSKSQKGNTNMEKLSKAQQKQLFSAAFDLDNAITKHEQEIETLTVKRSDAVKSIADAMGKGPFNVDGRFVTIRSRKGFDKVEGPDGELTKKENGKEIFFFVNAGDNVTVI